MHKYLKDDPFQKGVTAVRAFEHFSLTLKAREGMSLSLVVLLSDVEASVTVYFTVDFQM